MLHQDQLAINKQVEFTNKIEFLGETITKAISQGFTAVGASQQATTPVANTLYQYPQTSYPQGGWNKSLTPAQMTQVMQNTVSPPPHQPTICQSDLRTHETRTRQTAHTKLKMLTRTPTDTHHLKRQPEKIGILTHTDNHPTPPHRATATVAAGAGAARHAGGSLLGDHGDRPSRHHRRESVGLRKGVPPEIVHSDPRHHDPLVPG
jgi:hypothetical protein